jgi:hypothetical protein
MLRVNAASSVEHFDKHLSTLAPAAYSHLIVFGISFLDTLRGVNQQIYEDLAEAAIAGDDGRHFSVFSSQTGAVLDLVERQIGCSIEDFVYFDRDSLLLLYLGEGLQVLDNLLDTFDSVAGFSQGLHQIACYYLLFIGWHGSLLLVFGVRTRQWRLQHSGEILLNEFQI